MRNMSDWEMPLEINNSLLSSARSVWALFDFNAGAIYTQVLMSKPPSIGDSYSIFTEAPERKKKIEMRIYTVELTVPW